MVTCFHSMASYNGIMTVAAMLLMAIGVVDGSGCPQPYIDNGYETHRSGKPLLFPRTLYRIGSTAFLSCNPGYAMQGSREFKCGSDSKWNQSLPYCISVNCPQPNIPNSFIIPQTGEDMIWETEYIYLDTVKLQCDAGYLMRGRSEIQCGSDGKWTDLPACQPVNCPQPNVPNAFIIPQRGGEDMIWETEYIYLNMVKLQCDAGYLMRGRSEIQCGSDGRWTDLPACQPADCGPPTPLQFAEPRKTHTDKDTFPVGSTVTYSCLPGYFKIFGMTSVTTCKEDSQWSEISEFCRPKSCGSPGDVHGGWFEVTGHIVGSVATLFCHKGYIITGSTTQRQCLESGVWSNDVPNCEPILCEPPPDIPNAAHSGVDVDKFPYLGSVSYYCNIGTLHGENSIYCTEHGNWSAPAPECVDVSCPMPSVPNGKLQGRLAARFSYGDSVEFRCNAGYSPYDSITIRCGRDGMWYPTSQDCVPTICSTPEVKNGYIRDRLKKFPFEAGYSYSDTIIMVCEVGFRMTGQPLMKCEANGQWFPSLPICEPVSCRQPDVKHGNVIRDGEVRLDASNTITGTVNVQCQTGYVIHGDSEIRCDIYGRLSAVPTCEPVSCPTPDVRHGQIFKRNGDTRLGAGYKFKDSATVQCDAGYAVCGGREIRCEADGKWSPTVPTCEPVSLIEHQTTPIPGLQVQTLLNEGAADEGGRTCHDKFLPLGRQVFTCTEKGTVDTAMTRVVPVSVNALCESVGRSMKDHWTKMNVDDKYLHLEMGKLCLDIISLHLQIEKLNATLTPSKYKPTWWQSVTSVGFS